MTDPTPKADLSIREFVRVARRFWPFAARYRAKVWLGLLLIALSVPLTQFSIFLTRDLADRVFLATDQTYEVRWGTLLQILGLQAGFWLLGSLLSTAREVLEWYVSMRSTYDLRMAYYRHLYRLPLSFLQQRPPGEHVYRATEDIGPRDGDGYAPGLMGMVARMGPQLFESVYAVLWSGILLFLLDPTLALLLALYVVPFSLCAHAMYDRMRITAFGMRHRAEIEAAVLRDSVGGLRTIKASGRRSLQRRLYARAASDTKRWQNQLSFQTVLTTQGVVWSLRWTFQIVCFVFMAGRVIDGSATVGEWLASTLLAIEAQTPLEKAVQLVQQIRMQMVPAQRVLQTLDVEPTLGDRPNAPALIPASSEGLTVAFDAVHFAYVQGLPVLQGIDLRVPAGTHLGIVGPSGAGKSSLMSLLLRIYTPSAGTVQVDGQGVDAIELQSLLDACAVVPQQTYLYEGTIRDNILYGDPQASEETYLAAVERSGVGEFLVRQPEGDRTWVGEGSVLSGGERQRIGIARALVRNPRLLILDEATASLDAETEAGLLDTLYEAAKGRTAITIAHRLKAVERCDQIAVLDEGRVVQLGTHAELLAKPGLYQDLWRRQAEEARGATFHG